MEPPTDPDLRTLYNLLDGTAVRALRRQNTVCIATSGGLDSSLLAALIANQAEIPLQLITACAPGAPDAARARLLARHLDAPLAEIVLTPPKVRALLSRVVPIIGREPVDPARAEEWGLPPGSERVSPIRAAVAIVLLACADEARRHAKRLVLGQGADEWFGGYARYSEVQGPGLQALLDADRRGLDETGIPIEARIAKAAGIQFYYPYLDPRVKAFAAKRSMTDLVDGNERKRPLRALARWIGLPPEIVDVQKTAAQYGSGTADVLRALAAEAGMPQNDFLTAMLDQRTIGEPHSLRT